MSPGEGQLAHHAGIVGNRPQQQTGCAGFELFPQFGEGRQFAIAETPREVANLGCGRLQYGVARARIELRDFSNRAAIGHSQQLAERIGTDLVRRNGAINPEIGHAPEIVARERRPFQPIVE